MMTRQRQGEEDTDEGNRRSTDFRGPSAPMPPSRASGARMRRALMRLHRAPRVVMSHCEAYVIAVHLGNLLRAPEQTLRRKCARPVWGARRSIHDSNNVSRFPIVWRARQCISVHLHPPGALAILPLSELCPTTTTTTTTVPTTATTPVRHGRRHAEKWGAPVHARTPVRLHVESGWSRERRGVHES